MGREIRRVPPNWEHPKNEEGSYVPMKDWGFDTALDEWVGNYRLWKAGKHPDQEGKPDRINMPYWEWDGGPPDPETCRPVFTEDPIWYQVYETVSEGTPVTPPFSSKAELVDYLVENGDYWDQRRGDGGWEHAIAKGFVDREYAPSMTFTMISQGVTNLKMARDGMGEDLATLEDE